MPDFGRWDANGGDPSLNAINRTDRFLDALAAEQPVHATDHGRRRAGRTAGRLARRGAQATGLGSLTQRDAETVLQRAPRARSGHGCAGGAWARRRPRCCASVDSVPSSPVRDRATRSTGCARCCSASSRSPATTRSRWPPRPRCTGSAAHRPGRLAAAQDKLELSPRPCRPSTTPKAAGLQQQLNELTVKVENRIPRPRCRRNPRPSRRRSAAPCRRAFHCRRVPQLPPTGPGVPLPDISLPQLPPLPQIPLPGSGAPGPIVPPDTSLPPIADSPKPLSRRRPSRPRRPSAGPRRLAADAAAEATAGSTEAGAG